MDRRKTRDVAKHVVLVDDDPHARSYFKEIIQSTDDFKLAGDFSNTTEALTKIPFLRPHLMMLSIPLLSFRGIKWIRRFKQILVGLKIIIVTGMPNPDLLELSLQAGAVSCLVKPVSGEQCLATLRIIGYNGIQDEVMPLQSDAEFSSGATSRKCSTLSQREQEVMDGLAEGLLYKEIAGELGISYSAVHKYQQNIFRKFHVSNRSEAIRIWMGIEYERSSLFQGRLKRL